MNVNVKWFRERFTWRSGLMATVALLALVLLLPALMTKETALEITLASERGSLPDGFYIYQRLDERGIRIKSITPARDSLIILLDSPEQALAAQHALEDLLPDNYSISRSRQYPRWHWLPYLHNGNAKVG
ncbi:EnvZ/OmpR regulon moderator MzrA [Acerihabitans arboris]|uniref:Modulator protein MzrA n=1 Tax=Acerihabitans arboris TaxID=2691583 RepID=A0A845SR04_9GAMM|nr:EnvZ/OmpR regulon moderator MzrA [Acerihabitans arboris]NDL63575.1 EnvZ/OmpR regulon moderator MzrA [Acerihabitans arboris]